MRKSFGRSRERKPDVDNAARAGFPVPSMTTRQDRDGRSIPHVCHERHRCWPATARGVPQTRERNVGNAAEYEFIAQRDRSQRAFLARYRAFPNSKRGFSTSSLIQLDGRTRLETWYGGGERSAGGDGGIRTLDRALQPYNGLANRRLQPLGHISGRNARRDICPTHPPIASAWRSSLRGLDRETRSQGRRRKASGAPRRWSRSTIAAAASGA